MYALNNTKWVNEGLKIDARIINCIALDLLNTSLQ